jgi:hypothetical protein
MEERVLIYSQERAYKYFSQEHLDSVEVICRLVYQIKSVGEELHITKVVVDSIALTKIIGLLARGYPGRNSPVLRRGVVERGTGVRREIGE